MVDFFYLKTKHIIKLGQLKENSIILLIKEK